MIRLRKNGWKMILDIIMAVLLVLMYNKRILGMDFHEIGGLAVCGLFLIHKVLNWKWIKAVTTGLFSRRVPGRQKLFWILDLLLFLSFSYVLVSGILISKVVFPGLGGGMAFKMGHYAAAALALVFTGLHIGLHVGWIGQRMKFLKRLPLVLRRVLAVTLSIAVLAFGGLQLTSTSFLSWLGNIGAVFGAAQSIPEGGSAQHGLSSSTSASTDDDSGTALLLQSDETSAETGTEAGDTTRDSSGMGPARGGHDEGGAASSSNVASVLLGFMSLMLSFATLTAWADAALRTVRRKRSRHTAAQNPAIA